MPFILILATLSVPVYAQESKLDAASKDALLQTQALLMDKDQRDKAIKKDPKAVEVDNRIQQLTGGNPETNQKVYAIAAEIMGMIAEDAKGDSTKMQESLVHYMRDPAGFFNKLTPEQREKIRKLAEELRPRKN